MQNTTRIGILKRWIMVPGRDSDVHGPATLYYRLFSGQTLVPCAGVANKPGEGATVVVLSAQNTKLIPVNNVDIMSLCGTLQTTTLWCTQQHACAMTRAQMLTIIKHD
jgi:hypothetical protein